MKKPNLILLGAGGHAQACIDVIEQEGKFNIAGLVGLPDEVGTSRGKYQVLASDDDLPNLLSQCQFAIVSLGQINSPKNRIRLYERAVEIGFQLPTIISPRAYISPSATIGAGTIVMHGAIVNANASIASNCIINTRAVIEHDAKVLDNCHISTGVIVNGNSKVGAGSFIGSGSLIKEDISIGKNAVVGMGLTLRHNLPDDSKFLG